MDCRSCKRGRSNGRAEGAGGAAIKKKAKRAVKAAADQVVHIYEEVNNEGFMVVDEMAAAEVEELWIGVDGMPWATWWLPFWEVETIGDALYEDVVWDYDIWGLNAAAHTTISPTI